MATQAPTKDQLAKVRRLMLQRPRPSPEALAQSAARTPNITRFIKARQNKLEKLKREAAEAFPLTTSTASSRYAAVKPFDRQALPSRIEKKTRIKDDKIKVRADRLRRR